MAITIGRKWIPSVQSSDIGLPFVWSTTLPNRIRIVQDGVLDTDNHAGSYAWDFSFSGADVLAATSETTSSVYRVLTDGDGVLDSLGNGLIIKHDIGGSLFFSTYGHMHTTSVGIGTPISGGTIGVSGNSGTPANGGTYAAHLHFQATQLYDSEQEWVASGNGTMATSTGSDFSPVVFPTAIGTVFGGLLVRGDTDLSADPGLLDENGAKNPVLPNLFLIDDEGGSSISVSGNSDGNIISGNNASNTISGLGGSDVLFSGGGNDTVYGEGGGVDDGAADVIYAGMGEDEVYGGAGGDWIAGDSGEYRQAMGLLSSDESAIVEGMFGLDQLVDGFTTGDPIDYRFGDIFSVDGADSLFGGSGSDTIFGGTGNDTIYGGGVASNPDGTLPDDDVIFGGEGDDHLFGELGNDTIFGGIGSDTAYYAAFESTDGTGSFTLTPLADGGLEVRQLNSGSLEEANGTDVLYGVEWLKFEDGTVIEVSTLTGTTVVSNEQGVDAGTWFSKFISTVKHVIMPKHAEAYVSVEPADPSNSVAAFQDVETGQTYEFTSAVYVNFDNGPVQTVSDAVDPPSESVDDHGDTRADATSLGSISGTEYTDGEIEESGDKDFFSFSTTNGHKYGIVAIPAGGAVDPAIRVYDASGRLVGSNNDIPGEPTAAGYTFIGNGGTYYVEVTGEGSSRGDYALGVTDYSDGGGGSAPGGGSEPGVDIGIPSVTWDYRGTDDDEKVSYLTSDTHNRYVATFGGDDTVRTGRGNDVILSGDDDDEIDSGGGHDTVYGDRGDDDIDGGDGNDGLLGGDGEDTIDGGDGDDTIGGQRHDDRIYGRDGNDILVGEDGEDYITGGDGNDSISGGDDEDTLYGGDDNDLIYGGDNADRIRGDDGNDVLYGGDGQDTISGGDGNDRIEGEDHDDELSGGDGNDLILGGRGDDTIRPGSGDDNIDGDAGSDWLYYGNDDGGAVIDMVKEIAYGAEIGYDVFDSIEHVTGTNGNDLIIGDSDDNILEGDRGNDRIIGGAGNDSIEGGTGTNTAVFTGTRSDYSITASTVASFQFQVIDNRAGSPDGTDLLDDMDFLEFADVTIRDEHALSTAPSANADNFETWSDRPAVFDVLANDTDPENDPLAILSIIAMPERGTAYIVDDQVVFDPGDAFDFLAPEERTTVGVTYRATDENGWFSDATVTIEVVAPPQIDPSVEISGVTEEDQTLTAELVNVEDVGAIDSLSFSWLRDGVEIPAATGSTYTLTQEDVEARISVEASWSDGSGVSTSLTSRQTGPVENANDLPSGAVVIDGAAYVGQTLTADTSALVDDDGIGVFEFQWSRGNSPIDGASTASYVLEESDLGTAISVQVSWVDLFGTAEAVTSDPTGLVSEKPEPDLIARNVVVSSTSWIAGDTIKATWEIVNQGDASAANTVSRLYLSEDQIITTDDILLMTDMATGVMDPGEVNPEGDGSTSQSTDPFLVLASWSPGTYYLGAIADTEDEVAEGQEHNNVSAPIEVTIIPGIKSIGTRANEVFTGTEFDDVLKGLGGKDRLYGGYGDDLLNGGGGRDRLYGGEGNDVLVGGSGNDKLYGFSGEDRLIGGTGDDVMDGGEGIDTADYSGRAQISVSLGKTGRQDTGQGLDKLRNIENVIGGMKADTLSGNANANGLVGAGGNDRLYGKDGNDVLSGGTGRDILNGGRGMDTAVFDSGANIRVDLGTTRFQNTGEGRDRLLLIENVFTGDGDDTLIGNRFSNWFDGGAGNDVLTGGGEADLFIFTAGFGHDTVTDFEVGLAAEMLVFSTLASSTSEFTLGTASDGVGTRLTLAATGEWVDLLGVTFATEAELWAHVSLGS